MPNRGKEGEGEGQTDRQRQRRSPTTTAYGRREFSDDTSQSDDHAKSLARKQRIVWHLHQSCVRVYVCARVCVCVRACVIVCAHARVHREDTRGAGQAVVDDSCASCGRVLPLCARDTVSRLRVTVGEGWSVRARRTVLADCCCKRVCERARRTDATRLIAWLRLMLACRESNA
jgi:hypothetical protein